MSTVEHLAYAAEKAASRKEYVAFYLDAFQRSERVSEAELMEKLRCGATDYHRLCLMTVPDFQAPSFGDVAGRIAGEVNADPTALISVLRRSHVLCNIAEAEGKRARILLAARDKDPPEPPRTE